MRRGFTLIELLVVVGIVGLLLAIVLPAIQQARETARRLECGSHLRQIGFALANYQNGQRGFPSGYVSSFDSLGNDTGPGWGWATAILSNIELQSIQNKLDFRAPIEAIVNREMRLRKLPIFLCPSDTVMSPWTAVKRNALGVVLSPICDVAASNYVGVFGVSEPGIAGEGIFFRNSFIGIQEITDGTSNTIVVGERSQRWCEATWVGAVTLAQIFPPSGSPALPFVGNASGMILGHSFEGPPNSGKLECNCFSSAHQGGAQFVFADGHLQFISSSLDTLVFRAISTRAGNESIGEF